eukprot:XP_019076361.1 PREDICTED: probable WRKY transcription factor 72 isoform X2 [Vitis vinifera]
MENNSIDPSTQKNQEDRIKSAKEEVGEVREENERLKQILAKIKKDYQSLQMQFSEIAQHEEARKSTDTILTHQEEEEEETDLISLSLGRVSSAESKKDDKKTSFLSGKGKGDEKMDEGLALGLECKFEPAPTEHMMNASPENSFEGPKEEEPSTETWPPSKILKMGRSRDEEVLEQTHLKKARVSVRARCDTPTMNDGCQWRKYGQKIAKGNPCPRAYYRCTVSPSCPVRKQVQRCAEDTSILITTYEGTHNHPLPVSATAMASTTSAAASMLRSGSSTSQPGMEAFATSSTANLHGLNFSIPQNSRSQQFYFPNSSFSTSNSHPTITLDLTAPTASHFNRLSSSFPSAPRYPATCLNFSSSSSSSPLDPNNLPTSWGTLPSYGALSSYNKNQIGPFNFGMQPPSQENIYQPYMQKINNQAPSQQSLTETIATATKAIAADPTFRSALAAVITSFVGNAGGAGGGENHVKGENPSHNLKWGEFLSVNSALASSHNGVGCASSYLNRSSSANSQQQGNLISYPPSFPFSVPKSASASPSDHKDNIQ